MLERCVKKRISKALKSVERPDLMYYYMPVPGPYGGHTLDYIGWYRRTPFAIEAKAPGKNPTPRQQTVIDRLQKSGAAVFVIDGDISELTEFFKMLDSRSSKMLLTMQDKETNHFFTLNISIDPKDQPQKITDLSDKDKLALHSIVQREIGADIDIVTMLDLLRIHADPQGCVSITIMDYEIGRY